MCGMVKSFQLAGGVTPRESGRPGTRRVRRSCEESTAKARGWEPRIKSKKRGIYLHIGGDAERPAPLQARDRLHLSGMDSSFRLIGGVTELEGGLEGWCGSGPMRNS